MSFDIACPRCSSLSFFAYNSPDRGKVWCCINCKVGGNHPLRWHRQSARLWEDEETPELSKKQVKVIMAPDVETEYFKW